VRESVPPVSERSAVGARQASSVGKSVLEIGVIAACTMAIGGARDGAAMAG